MGEKGGKSPIFGLNGSCFFQENLRRFRPTPGSGPRVPPRSWGLFSAGQLRPDPGDPGPCKPGRAPRVRPGASPTWSCSAAHRTRGGARVRGWRRRGHQSRGGLRELLTPPGPGAESQDPANPGGVCGRQEVSSVRAVTWPGRNAGTDRVARLRSTAGKLRGGAPSPAGAGPTCLQVRVRGGRGSRRVLWSLLSCGVCLSSAQLGSF